MTLTITLPQGARRTARKKVLVKQLSAIEGFGSVEILCSDKTGTLTEGDIVLDRRVDLHGQDNENFLQFVYLNCHFQAGIIESAGRRHPDARAPCYYRAREGGRNSLRPVRSYDGPIS